MNESLVLILALVLISLVMLLIGLLVMYLKLLTKHEELKHGKDKNVDPDVLISQARLRSQQILEEAHVKARETLKRSQDFVNTENGVIAKELTKLHETYAKSYLEAINASKTKAEQMINNIPQDIKITLITAIDSFRISLSHEVNKAQSEATKAIKEAYEKAAEEVNKYKEERMKQVDQGILVIVKDVTEKVLGKSVSLEEHEKLVEKSLEEAKKQKIF